MSEHDNSLALFYFLFTAAGAFLLLMLFLWGAKKLGDFANYLRIRRETKHGVYPEAVKNSEMTPSRQPWGDIKDHVALARKREAVPVESLRSWNDARAQFDLPPHKCRLRVVREVYDHNSAGELYADRYGLVFMVCLSCRRMYVCHRNDPTLFRVFPVVITSEGGSIDYRGIHSLYTIVSRNENLFAYLEVTE